MQERLVTLEVLLREVLRRLDSEVTPRHADHETRIRVAEGLLSEIKVRVALVSGGGGIAGGIITAVLAHLIGGGA